MKDRYNDVGDSVNAASKLGEGPVVVDLLCYLPHHTELSIRAKGLLMMGEQGCWP